MTALMVLLISSLASAPGPPTAASAGPPDGELAALGALIVGQWEGENSRHVHEWGVGRRLIRSRSYAPGEGDEEWALVSEGVWYWDGEEGVIRGLHFAVGMPMDRMEYRTVVKNDEVVHDLRTHGEMPGRFVETWTFEDDRYEWTLERPTESGPERMMGGSYRRIHRGGVG